MGHARPSLGHTGARAAFASSLVIQHRKPQTPYPPTHLGGQINPKPHTHPPTWGGTLRPKGSGLGKKTQSWLIALRAVAAPPPLPAVGRSTFGRCPRAALTPLSACYSTYLCCCPRSCFAFAVAARRHRWCCCVAVVVPFVSLFAVLACASAVVLRFARRCCSRLRSHLLSLRSSRDVVHRRRQELRRLIRRCGAKLHIRTIRRCPPPRPRPRRQRLPLPEPPLVHRRPLLLPRANHAPLAARVVSLPLPVWG